MNTGYSHFNKNFDDPLEINTLLTAAKSLSQVSEIVDYSFFSNLQIYLAAIANTGELSVKGVQHTRSNVIRLLASRFIADETIARHPEILQIRIENPVFIMGVMRSGTTRLHRQLAADDRFLFLRLFETFLPALRNKVPLNGMDPRIAILDDLISSDQLAYEDQQDIHPATTLDAEEELGLLEHSFFGLMPEVQYKINCFARVDERVNSYSGYEYMRKLIQLISWQRGDKRAGPWVFKTPQHMLHIPLLLKLFPDARFVFTHRDPLKVVASTCSMMVKTLSRNTDAVDPVWIGRHWLENIECMLKTAERDRALISPERQLDIQYEDVNHKAPGIFKKLYDFLGIEPPQIEAKRSLAFAETPMIVSSKHNYSLAQFGLSEGYVDARLFYYRAKYAVPYERH